MNKRTAKVGRATSVPGQLTLFDSFERLNNLHQQAIDRLFTPENRNLGGILDSIPPLRSYFSILPGTPLFPKGDKAKLKANIQAIHCLRAIQQAQRPATQAEKEILVQYTGWGGLSQVFDATQYDFLRLIEENELALSDLENGPANWIKKYGEARKQLQDLLTDTERQQAEQSTLNAFYTSKEIINAVYKGVSGMGFSGGAILEPGAGIGHFIGLMPPAIRDASTITAVELDGVSSQFLTTLYPEIEVINSGLEDFSTPNSFDLVIGNVPFGGYRVYDRENRDLSQFPIHNYFIGRSARLLRPGGLMALITTAGTLDTEGKTFRYALAEEAVELAGAIRLPSVAFEENAGTQVTTDILFMRKRKEGKRLFPQHSFTELVTVKTDWNPTSDEPPADKEIKAVRINEYFAERPLQMIGEMTFAHEVNKGGLYRDDRQTLFLADPAEFTERLEKAIDALPKGIYEECQRLPFGKLSTQALAVSAQQTYHKAVHIKGRSFLQSVIIGQYEALKHTFNALLAAEIDLQDDEVTEPLRETLNTQYNRFVGLFGNLNKNRHIGFLEQWDPKFPMMQALEMVERHTDKTGRSSYVCSKSGIFFGRVYAKNPIPDKIGTVADALRLSLYWKGSIDVDFMTLKLNEHRAGQERKTNKQVWDELLRDGLAFIDPHRKTLIERTHYLSGNIREKLKEAQELVLDEPRLQANIQALETVLPPSIPISLITFQLGSVWLPTDIIQDFIAKTLEMPVKVTYNDTAGQYEISNQQWTVRNKSLGTPARQAIDLIEAALNGKTIVITKTVYVDGQKKEVKDPEAISQAVQAQEALQELFVEFGREQYAERIETVFNERFNSTVLKTYVKPGVVTYPGANPHVFLREHQFRGVERAKDQDTLFAHVVGSGKTFTMITAAMELKRLGKISKAIIAVQNSTVDDFGRAWKYLYPSAIIYIPDKTDLEASNRQRFLQRIATNNFDGIVLPNSFLKLIPDDPTDVETIIQKEISRYTASLGTEGRYGGRDKKTVKQINAKKAAIATRLRQQGDRKTDTMLHFGQLGVDFLALDEAHTKKRLGFSTGRRNIKGIDTSGSEDALQALTKCRTVQRKGGRVILATGTPISNTMAEAWTMLRFIAERPLQKMQLETFDQFAGTFGQIIPSLELTTTGTFKAVERFARFINVGQLSELYRTYVDVVLNEDVIEFKRDNTLPKLKDGAFTSIIIPQTEGVADELDYIKSQLMEYEKMSGSQKKENRHIPLVMFGQARKVTLDIRLLDACNPDEPGSKVNRAVEEIYNRYQLTSDYKGTQLVFSDTFQSPAVHTKWLDENETIKNPSFGTERFNVFRDMQAKLLAKGIPAAQIAIVPEDAGKREAVFAKVRSGEVRIMFGSSERMGVGVNVQERLYAVHHLDAPNRPTDFEQRNGRLIRQGNLHASWGKEIEVVTYGVEKTLDATAYGRLAVKQKFINQVLKGTISSDVLEDISTDDDFSAMSFDQMMATLSGSQYALLYTAKNHELQRLKQKRKNWQRGLIDAQLIIDRSTRNLNSHTERLPQLELEKKLIESAFSLHPSDDQTQEPFFRRVELNGMVFTSAKEWAKPVDELLKKLIFRFRRGAVANGTIQINGLTIGLVADLVQVDYDGQGLYGVNYSWGLTLKSTITTGSGLFTSLRATVNAVQEAPQQARQTIAYCEKMIEEYSRKLTVPFKQQAELDALEEEVLALEAKLKEENQTA